MTKKEKLEKFFLKQLTTDIKDMLIVRDELGNYELFGKYRIEQYKNGLCKVIRFRYAEEHMFSSLKNAFIWCIFNKNSKISESKRIKELDFLLDSLNTRLYQQSRLYLKSKTPDIKFIYLAKIHENKIKRNQILKEIKTFTSISRYCQHKIFTGKEPK